MSFSDGLTFVLGASPSDNVRHSFRYVIPMLRFPEHPGDGCVAVTVIGSISVADLHPTTFHDDIRSFGCLTGRIASSFHPRHLKFDKLRIGRQFLAQVFRWGQPIVTLEIGHVVVGDRQSTLVVVVVLFVLLGRGSHDTTALEVRHQPTVFATDFSETKICRNTTTGTIETETTGTSFRIFLT